MSDAITTAPDFDVLEDIWKTLRIQGSIFFQSELAAPWGILLAAQNTPRFHISLAGQCFVGSTQSEAVQIQEMGIIMLPNGGSHWIADRPGRTLVPAESAGEACELGTPLFQQGEITNRLMCGLVNFDQDLSHPILDSLPNILHFPEQQATSPIWMTVTLIDSEMQRSANGGGPIVDRLTEVLFMQLLNHYVGHTDAAHGFVAALTNKRIHQALTLIHQHPEIDWTLASLGNRIGMSSATLVRHFQDTVGVAPMAYVNNWRIMKAHNLVKYSSATLEQIADMVGFNSTRTLNRTFQRHYDCTPTQLRRANQGANHLVQDLTR